MQIILDERIGHHCLIDYPEYNFRSWSDEGVYRIRKYSGYSDEPSYNCLSNNFQYRKVERIRDQIFPSWEVIDLLQSFGYFVGTYRELDKYIQFPTNKIASEINKTITYSQYLQSRLIPQNEVVFRMRNSSIIILDDDIALRLKLTV